MPVPDCTALLHLICCRDQVSAAECAQSHWSYLCEDFHRLGYDSMLLDPAVRISYSPSAFSHELFGIKVDSIPYVPWGAHALEPLDMDFIAPRTFMMCCPATDYGRCHSREIFGVNHTRTFLAANFPDLNLDAGGGGAQESAEQSDPDLEV